MTARDELENIVHDAMYPGGDRDDRMTWPRSIFDAATAFLAAGYTKPRTISTVEELDALPVGAIVQDAYAVGCQRTNKWLHHEWERIGHANPHGPYLPATVLYEPQP